MGHCTTIEENNTLFPVFFKLEQLHTLIVGGGAVGLEKLTAILTNAPEAKVTLVGKCIHPEIKKLAAKHASIMLKEKPFSASDLYGADLAIVATNDREENDRIHDMAKAMHVLVNVADTPVICDFYLGSIVQKGSLKIAISTNGKSPTLAKRLREIFTEIIPDEMESVLKNLRLIRNSLKGDFAYKVKKLNEITAVMTKG